MNLKLNQLKLPMGAGPIQFNSNFGDTAALMLTVASPMVTPTEVALRSIAIKKAIERTRSELPKNAPTAAGKRHLCVPHVDCAGAGASGL